MTKLHMKSDIMVSIEPGETNSVAAVVPDLSVSDGQTRKMPTILEEDLHGRESCGQLLEQEASPSSIAESGFEEEVATPTVPEEGKEKGFFTQPPSLCQNVTFTTDCEDCHGQIRFIQSEGEYRQPTHCNLWCCF